MKKQTPKARETRVGHPLGRKSHASINRTNWEGRGTIGARALANV